jgi:hypothetical protein
MHPTVVAGGAIIDCVADRLSRSQGPPCPFDPLQQHHLVSRAITHHSVHYRLWTLTVTIILRRAVRPHAYPRNGQPLVDLLVQLDRDEGRPPKAQNLFVDPPGIVTDDPGLLELVQVSGGFALASGSAQRRLVR